jgi:hypothetical protein
MSCKAVIRASEEASRMSSVLRGDGLGDAQRHLVVSRGLGSGRAHPWESRSPPKPGSRVQKLGPIRLSRPISARGLLHIGADLLTEISDFIDESDLGRQERVGRVFDEFGGAPVV